MKSEPDYDAVFEMLESGVFHEGKKAGDPAGGGPPDEPREPREWRTVEHSPVEALGRHKRLFYYLTAGKELTALRASDHKPQELMALFDGLTLWPVRAFPRKSKEGKIQGFHTTNLTNWLMSRCAKVGHFDPSRKVRGAGAWRGPVTEENPYGTLILHVGDAVLIDGEVYEAGRVLNDGYVYPSSHAEPRPATEEASDAEIEALLDHLRSWVWQRPDTDPLVLLGWIGTAVICGALHWRPHVWVTGDKGTGKTTLEKLLSLLLGGSAERSADATSAGIRQKLDGAARPVMLDEIEAEASGFKLAEIVKLARLASTDDQAAVTRGSADGVARGWAIRASFYFTSILPAPLKPADRDRIVILNLDPLPASEEGAAQAKRAMLDFARLGPHLRARMVKGWRRFNENAAVFEAALGLAHGGRVADQLGTLLAGYWTLAHDSVVTPAAADDLVKRFEIEEITGYADEADHNECATWLLSTMIGVDVEGGPRRERNIGELVQLSRGVAKCHEDLALRRHGLGVGTTTLSTGAAAHWLYVANRHVGLEKIFAGTRWHGGGWQTALARLPFVERGVTRSYSGRSQRSLSIPWESVAIEPLASPLGKL